MKGDYTVVELCKQFDVASSQVFKWKKQLLDGASDIFAASGAKASFDMNNCDKLYQQ